MFNTLLVALDGGPQHARVLDLAAAMRAKGYRLPVVIASGFISEDLRSRSAQVGVAELLHKPDTVEELCRSIERVLKVAGSST